MSQGRPRARRRIARAAVLALAWLAALEIGARAYWWIEYHVLPVRPSHLLLAFYPELRHGMRSHGDDPRFDVLLLGGSVLNYTRDALQDRLSAAIDAPVLVRNTAWPSHASRDSLLKYRWLENERYDLVIFYHAINELRANNAPPELFRDDYSHYSWYRNVNALAERGLRPSFVLPFTLDRLRLAAAERFGRVELVPTHQPRPEWLAFGAEVKTAAPFRANLEAIAELARRRGDPLLVMTFASYIPENYSEEAFREGRLDYTPTEHTHPIEIWGRPAHIAAGLRVHNAAIREVVAGAPDLLFVDQEREIPAEGAYFGDVCHLSEAGVERFVANLLPVALGVRNGTQP